VGRRLKDNIKIKFGGIGSEYMNGRSSEYMNGSTKPFREDYVRGMLSTVHPQCFVFHFAVYGYRDDIYIYIYIYTRIILHGFVYGRETGLLHSVINIW
jgi:hypothetical protein